MSEDTPIVDFALIAPYGGYDDMKTFEEVFASLPARGWLTRDEALLLYKTALLCKGDILEVGSYCGRSSVLLTSLGRTVHCVDPFKNFDSDDPSGERTKQEFFKNMVERNIKNFWHYNMPIEQWFSIACGFAYLDGDHTYAGTIAQIEKGLEALLLQMTGEKWIAAHDVNDDGGGLEVKRACLELLGPWKERVGRLAVWRMK